MVIDYFELQRQVDELVYQFDRMKRDDGTYGYKRRDADLWILKEGRNGWIAVDPVTGDVAGRPWSVLPEDQLDYPPEGEWVSKKGVKSYVYLLVHSRSSEQL